MRAIAHSIPDPGQLEALAAFARDVQLPLSLVRISGHVTAVSSAGISVRGLSRVVKVGDFVRLGRGPSSVPAEVVFLDPEKITVKPLEPAEHVSLDTPVTPMGSLEFHPDESWKGRLISALGEPVDGGPELGRGPKAVTLNGRPPRAMERAIIGEKLVTGVKAIDVFTPLCYGQRVGVFAGSGVGKSTLLAMLAQAKGFDCAVIALVGERGREVSEFVEEVLGPARAKSIVIVATGDESATKRKLAPMLATSVAEYFRDCGQRVLLVMDSVTRFALAARETALAAGEPPVARGFPPSVFSALPQLLERAGPGTHGQGSITGIYAVLVDGDNHNDPIADAIRGTLDGHIVLDRGIAASGRYPAMDLLGSVSRLSHKAWTDLEQKAAIDMRKLVSRYEDSKDMRALGGYTPGADLELDRAMTFVPKLYAALTQSGRDGPCDNAFADIAQATRAPPQMPAQPQK